MLIAKASGRHEPGRPKPARAAIASGSFGALRPDRFAWLLAPGPSDRVNSPDEDEFSAACEFALAEWQVLPAIAPKLLAWGGPGVADSRQAQRVRDRDIALRALGGLQLALAKRLVDELAAASIRYVFLKGSAVRFTSYSDPVERCGKDLDIAVGHGDLARAEGIAAKLGFEPAEWSYETRHFHRPDPVLRKIVEAQHYELGFLARRLRVRGLSNADAAAIRRDMPDQFIWHEMPSGDLGCYVTLDVHHGLSLDIDVGPIIDDALAIDSGGLRAQVPSPGWLAFQLLFKLYWEGVHSYRKGGYQYADLSRLIPSLDTSGFAKLEELLREHKLEVAGHYVMRRLASDLGVGPLPLVDAFVRRTLVVPTGLEPGECNDLGDVWPKLWGIR